ncbi:MAG: hypothetical protein ACE5IL_07495 [Myxococcota bacterium]
MRHGLLAALLGLGLGLSLPGPSRATGDVDLEIPIYMGAVSQIDATARTVTVSGKRIYVPVTVAGFASLAPGAQVTIEVKREDARLVATAIHLN